MCHRNSSSVDGNACWAWIICFEPTFSTQKCCLKEMYVAGLNAGSLYLCLWILYFNSYYSISISRMGQKLKGWSHVAYPKSEEHPKQSKKQQQKTQGAGNLADGEGLLQKTSCWCRKLARPGNSAYFGSKQCCNWSLMMMMYLFRASYHPARQSQWNTLKDKLGMEMELLLSVHNLIVLLYHVSACLSVSAAHVVGSVFIL